MQHFLLYVPAGPWASYDALCAARWLKGMDTQMLMLQWFAEIAKPQIPEKLLMKKKKSYLPPLGKPREVRFG